jgi:hypothetical protein
VDSRGGSSIRTQPIPPTELGRVPPAGLSASAADTYRFRVPDIPRLPWYETPIWLLVQLAEIAVLTWIARLVAPRDLSKGTAIAAGVALVAVVFGANLVWLRWLRAHHRTD